MKPAGRRTSGLEAHQRAHRHRRAKPHLATLKLTQGDCRKDQSDDLCMVSKQQEKRLLMCIDHAEGHRYDAFVLFKVGQD